jgi:hypothetical protein
MQTLFALFSLESAEAAAAELEQRLGTEALNLIVQETVKDRLSNSRAQPAVPGARTAAPVAAPTLTQLLSRKRSVLLAETGPVYAVHALAGHILGMAQSGAPTKLAGSLKVALEEYGVATHYAEAYATGVQYGYVLLFAELPDDQVLEISERCETRGGREVFAFQRLE